MQITINPDKEYVKGIRDKLKDNNNHCPCNLKHDKSTLCMCEDFRNQTTDGWCHCSLYHKQMEENN